jgi:N-acetylglucosamine kinase-like BadF-type ATPase
MSWLLSVAGSTHYMELLVSDERGEFVGHKRFSTGMHARETKSSLLVNKLRDSLTTIAEEKIGVNLGDLTKKVSKIAFCVSGTDHRYSNIELFGQLLALGFNVKKKDVKFRGIAEACFRSVLDDQPGLIIRAGTGASIFGVNSEGKFELGAAWASFLGCKGTSYNLGQEVLYALTRTADGISTKGDKHIADSALKLSNCSDAEELFSKIHDISVHSGARWILEEIGALSQILFMEAKNDNQTAQSILDSSRKHLFEISKKLIGKLHLDKIDNFKIILSGNLLESHEYFARKLYSELKDEFSNIQYIDEDKKYLSRVVGAGKMLLSGSDCYAKNNVMQNLENIIFQSEDGDLFWHPITLRT